MKEVKGMVFLEECQILFLFGSLLLQLMQQAVGEAVLELLQREQIHQPLLLCMTFMLTWRQRLLELTRGFCPLGGPVK